MVAASSAAVWAGALGFAAGLDAAFGFEAASA
jgi:hypothetical protein